MDKELKDFLKFFFGCIGILSYMLLLVLIYLKLSGQPIYYSTYIMSVSGNKGNILNIMCISKLGEGTVYIDVPPIYGLDTLELILRSSKYEHYNRDIFINVPPIEKLEGSSAGLGFKSCVEGALGRWICNNCVYTGVLNKDNSVGRVDMLYEKLQAAISHGFKEIYIPFSQTVFVEVGKEIKIIDTRKLAKEYNIKFHYISKVVDE